MALTSNDASYVEAVYAALLTQLETALPNAGLPAPYNTSLKFVLSDRVAYVPDQVPIANQPALLLIQGPSLAEQKELFGVTKWTFTAIAIIYFRLEGTYFRLEPSQPVTPSTLGNYLWWSVAQALARTANPYDKQTLGGLVYHCWIEGEVLLEVVEEQAIITIPIHILGN